MCRYNVKGISGVWFDISNKSWKMGSRPGSPFGHEDKAPWTSLIFHFGGFTDSPHPHKQQTRGLDTIQAQAWYLTEATEAIASVAPGLCLGALSKVPTEIYKFLIEVPFAKVSGLQATSFFLSLVATSLLSRTFWGKGRFVKKKSWNREKSWEITGLDICNCLPSALRSCSSPSRPIRSCWVAVF